VHCRSNGIVDNFVNTSGNGLDDNIAASLAPLTDTDSDGIPDSLDNDSDGDGISDVVEAGGVDTDNDGRVDAVADSDGDGVPDVNDVDETQGVDADSDNIDDAFDADFVTGEDSDADGVIDSEDPDNDGNGFVGPFDDPGSIGQGQTNPLPDANSDGVPDIQQSDHSRSNVIETGLAGNAIGCSVVPTFVNEKNRALDPMLGLLLGSSLMLLARRRGLFHVFNKND